LFYITFPLLQKYYLFRVNIETGNLETGIAEGNCQGQADITKTDDPDARFFRFDPGFQMQIS